jgi:ankyrin repeat protein
MSETSKLILSYIFKTNLATFRSAIIDDNTDKICRILDIEHDYINKEIDSGGNTPLLLAIKYATPLTVRLLLEQGAKPDQINEVTLQTPLGLIASASHEDYNSYKAQRLLEMGKILLEHGAYVDKPSIRSYIDDSKKEYSAKETPLMTAARRKNIPLVKFLINNKANIHYTERQLQIQPYVFISNIYILINK